VELEHLKTFLQSDFASGENQQLKQTVREIGEYFDKERTEFNIPLVFSGTDFQVKVWEALLEIPYGKTISYQDLTTKLGNPNAVRAVAGANGANKIAVLVPCHRVIGTDGSLTGYAGGMWRKQWLLEHESKQLKLGL
jgi:methylated-DNA-[protein]-cysteine S-methyltransferase